MEEFCEIGWTAEKWDPHSDSTVPTWKVREGKTSGVGGPSGRDQRVLARVKIKVVQAPETSETPPEEAESDSCNKL
ncbi:hypothetical protein PIB30_009114 [Stylosanthes scabra]|uniref:Uncharacterized protein n=1 Tax=Stylosanthes scabra TaxID=79078 RepID=A0ABU6W697_9FABA|nr:hypothetical protein [Stylosanthes scabra]